MRAVVSKVGGVRFHLPHPFVDENVFVMVRPRQEKDGWVFPKSDNRLSINEKLCYIKDSTSMASKPRPPSTGGAVQARLAHSDNMRYPDFPATHHRLA